MKSTGEVMGIHENFAGAFAKSQFASNITLPGNGRVFLSVRDLDKETLPEIARQLAALGFELVATGGTAQFLREHGLEVQSVRKLT
jgi:carbamoyl-phosphate synthase large subunit